MTESGPTTTRRADPEPLDLLVERRGELAVVVVRGKAVPVEGALPGERVKVAIEKRGRGRLAARVLGILERSKDRVAPRCSHFGVCGGCDWQHLAYEAQLEWKRALVEDAIGGGVTVSPTLPCPRPYGYRNKMEFSFGARRWLSDEEVRGGAEIDRGFALGLFVPGRYDRVLDLHECHLQSDESARLLNRVREVAKAHALPPWDGQKSEGYLRHLAIRQSRRGVAGPETMINLVTATRDRTRLAPIETLLREEFPFVTTFVNTIHSGVAQTTVGQECDVIFGAGVIHDRIGDLIFEIAPTAFFQTNTEQAERLYGLAAEFAGLRADDLLFDLFCGVGTISLFVAPRVRKVVGLELVADAVANAARNAAANRIAGVEFAAGDLLTTLPRALAAHGRPDVVILDPPRAGVHPKSLRAILELGADRVVYVSCNPKSLGADLALLRRDYRIEEIRPVDMFPQTTHVETVVKLRRSPPAV